MKSISFLILSLLLSSISFGQCSICTKTASQIGEEAGKGFNAGVLYLAAMPFAIIGYIGYKWWKNEKN